MSWSDGLRRTTGLALWPGGNLCLAWSAVVGYRRSTDTDNIWPNSRARGGYSGRDPAPLGRGQDRGERKIEWVIVHESTESCFRPVSSPLTTITHHYQLDLSINSALTTLPSSTCHKNRHYLISRHRSNYLIPYPHHPNRHHPRTTVTVTTAPTDQCRKYSSRPNTSSSTNPKNDAAAKAPSSRQPKPPIRARG